MARKRYLRWNELRRWRHTNKIWSDVSILLEAANAVGGGGGIGSIAINTDPWSKLRKDLGDEKTKRVIELYCNYKGIEYKESREIDDAVKVSVSDFQIFVKDSIKERINVSISF
jgi:hypothetical protein